MPALAAGHSCKCLSSAPPKPLGSWWQGGYKSWDCCFKPLGLGFCESLLSPRIPTLGLMDLKYCKSSPFSVLFCFFSFFPPDVCVFPLLSLAKASSAKAQGPGTPRRRNGEAKHPQATGQQGQNTNPVVGARRRRVGLPPLAEGWLSSQGFMESSNGLH